MKKIIILLLSIFILFSCGKKKEEIIEEVKEPLGYDGPLYLRGTNNIALEELKNYKIGLPQYFGSDYNEYILNDLNNYEINEDNIIYFERYEEIPDLIAQNKINAFLVDARNEEVIEDFRGDYNHNDYPIIKEYMIPYYETKELSSTITNNKLYNEPFVVMISGIDESVAPETIKGVRTDVNILMVVNPKLKHVLTISFPRDSYMLSSMYGYRDKMNALVQNGIDDLKDSVGNTLDVEVPYYVQESFSSFIDMINNLGGVWIHVPMDVYMDQDSKRDVKQPYSMEKGYYKVFGEWALALARNRKYNNIYGGDFGRIRNQALIINEIIARVAKYPDILDWVGMSWLYEKLVYTNFTYNDMLALIELGKSFKDGYTVDNYFIECADGQTESGAYIGLMLDYSLNIAKGKIKLVLNNEIDENNPYLSNILTGYISKGAGTYNDGGFIGEEYDLRDIFNLNIDIDLDLNN